jgi:hypothetical protein
MLARRLAEVARGLWLPPTATRVEVARAIETLSDAGRKAHLRAKIAGIPEDFDPAKETGAP